MNSTTTLTCHRRHYFAPPPQAEQSRGQLGVAIGWRLGIFHAKKIVKKNDIKDHGGRTNTPNINKLTYIRATKNKLLAAGVDRRLRIWTVTYIVH